MWREASLELRVCPVRFLTPETQAILAWFERTHELQVGFGAAYWRRHSLPGPGAIGDQGAALMAALEYVCRLRNALLVEDRPTRSDRDPSTTRKKGRRRG